MPQTRRAKAGATASARARGPSPGPNNGAPATAATLRRFLIGPVQSEITGVDTTPDGRTVFVGIQHPGENGTPAAPSSNWPANQNGAAPGVRPRSAVVAVTRTDGGIVGI
jgi:secreted PhoX family phosphatase